MAAGREPVRADTPGGRRRLLCVSILVGAGGARLPYFRL